MVKGKRLLGINGLGRIGKLTLWYHLQEKVFDGFVINVGREVGCNLDAVLHTILTDSTYGRLESFLYGSSKKDFVAKIVDEKEKMLSVDGMPIKILQTARNPADIGWGKEGVRLVIECTGKFTDPTKADDDAKGSIRGHLKAGAEKVILSAPFKIKDKSLKMPSDAGMFVFGVNHTEYDPEAHHVISGASCTTTGLAHMLKPLLENKQTSQIMTASMSTVHASTATQSILDSVPKTGSKDLRKNRSVLNNVILTTTGAAKALENILSQIQEIGFMADSVRIPTSTASLIILNLTFHSPLKENGDPVITRELINDIYKKAAAGQQKGLLVYSENQNVSADMIGFQASCVIEGAENHTRTGFMPIPSVVLKEHGLKESSDVRVPVTHAKLFGWYDNEFGSYVFTLGHMTKYVAKQMQ